MTSFLRFVYSTSFTYKIISWSILVGNPVFKILFSLQVCSISCLESFFQIVTSGVSQSNLKKVRKVIKDVKLNPHSVRIGWRKLVNQNILQQRRVFFEMENNKKRIGPFPSTCSFLWTYLFWHWFEHEIEIKSWDGSVYP